MPKIRDLGILGVTALLSNGWSCKRRGLELPIQNGGVPGRVRRHEDMWERGHVIIMTMDRAGRILSVTPITSTVAIGLV